MNDEEARHGLPATRSTARLRDGSTAGRTTGLQVAVVAIQALLEAFERQLAPREVAVLLDLVGRLVDRKRREHAAALERWVA